MVSDTPQGHGGFHGGERSKQGTDKSYHFNERYSQGNPGNRQKAVEQPVFRIGHAFTPGRTEASQLFAILPKIKHGLTIRWVRADCAGKLEPRRQLGHNSVTTTERYMRLGTIVNPTK
jgi:hypothetical protein